MLTGGIPITSSCSLCVSNADLRSWRVDKVVVHSEQSECSEEQSKARADVPQVVSVVEVPQDAGRVALTRSRGCLATGELEIVPRHEARVEKVPERVTC